MMQKFLIYHNNKKKRISENNYDATMLTMKRNYFGIKTICHGDFTICIEAPEVLILFKWENVGYYKLTNKDLFRK